MGLDRHRIRQLLERAWQPEGFCVPHESIYPFQWLWDSCFHALVWAELGDERALTELQRALAMQDPETGFVPHLIYWSTPDHHAEFWGRSMTSSITQPPMYGHALAKLVAADYAVPTALFAGARAGLANLLGRRTGTEPLVPVYHPWETGCDDSPRWDHWSPTGFDPTAWKRIKGELVAALVVDRNGFAVDSARFRVAAVGFNALVAWNIAELDRVGEADERLLAGAREIVAGLADRWNPTLATWADDSPTGSVRTADSLLPLLVDARPDALDALSDPAAFAGPFGIRGVHRQEPSYDPDTYWRGPSWPQLDYLLIEALMQAGRHDEAALLGQACAWGAERSGWAEYWNAEDAAGGGAAPQTWTTLALLMPQR